MEGLKKMSDQRLQEADDKFKKELTECIDMTLLILATLRIEFKLANEQAQLTHIRERNPLAQRIHNIVKPKQNRDLL